MTVADLLKDAFERMRELGHDAVEGLSTEQLTTQPEGKGNSIAWLVWHLARVQDDHLADAGGYEQVWTAQGWEQRFGLPFDKGETGYGQSSAEVAQVKADAALLAGYLDAVLDRTLDYLEGLTDADLDRVVDEQWDPPVTLGVRLVSVIGDDMQHLGQAAYVKGLLGT
ncbi:mycothiol transferase [Motilibacter deserti]|uniref:DinB family protein n=1 Tax=Motilibacter deserti TaxID=2714956 RepID=A0ABX0GS53_9ACTN|nr:DinB family protein [Motilibacter deserti]NHC13708.1 DinB family protein [Motilibacter deserti]